MKIRDIAQPTWRVALFALIALVLCFVPLFNVLGYESAAVYGVVGGIVASLIAPGGGRIHDLLAAIARSIGALLIPFTLLSLNALRVQNCDFAAGIEFWVAIAVVSAVLGSALSFVAHNVTRSAKAAKLLIVAVILASFADFGLRLALEPPITGHQLFLGYFSGSIYDEALHLPQSLVYFRTLNILLATALLAFYFAKNSTQKRTGFLVVGASAALLYSYGFWHRAEAGVDITRDVIASELGGFVETEHFEIYYPLQEPFVSNLERIKQDHEFRYAELSAFFETDPVATHGKKVRSFVYADRDSKGRLMGGRRTQVAKIWLREIHILWRTFGDHMLAHELAHVFTEPFGSGPLRLSARYGVLGINMGVVEGAATAADWHAPELNPHQVSAALIKLDKAPNLGTILSASGFWTQYSGVVYTLMGSFTKFLVDRYGIDTFKDAYSDGDFERAYGQSVDALVQMWKAYLFTVELTEKDLEQARYRYDRKSIFQKVCARKIADLRVRAGDAARRQRIREARAIHQQIVDFAPNNIGYLIAYARFLSSNDLNDDAIQIVDQADALAKTAVHRAQLQELRGDIEWKRGAFEAASRAYDSCLQNGLPNGMRRSVTVKSKVVAEPEFERRLGYGYLLERGNADISSYFPTEWVRRNPEHPIANYLLGRRLWQNRRWEDAKRHLLKAESRLGEATLEDENRRMLVECHVFTGNLAIAEVAAGRLSTAANPHYRMWGIEWLDRIAHRRGNTLQRR